MSNRSRLQTTNKTETTSLQPWKQHTILLLAGLGFSGIGVMFLIMVSRVLIQTEKLQNAIQVPAKILHVERVSSGGGGRGGSSTTTKAVYSYSFNNRSYKGDSISLWKGSDCETYRELADAKESGRLIPCFIDPDEPTLSTLDMEFSVWPFAGALIFMIAFSGVGVLILRAFYLGFTTPKQGYSTFVPGFSQKTKKS